MTDEGRDQLKEGRVSGSADRLNKPFQKESRLMQGQSPRVNPDRVVPEVNRLSCGCLENTTTFEDGSEIIRTDFCATHAEERRK